MLGFSPLQWIVIAALSLGAFGIWHVRGEVCDATIYKKQVEALQNENKRWQDSYNALKTTVEQQTAALAKDEDRRKTAETHAERLQERVNELEGKTTDAVCFRGPAADGVRNLWGKGKSAGGAKHKAPATLGGAKRLQQPQKAGAPAQGNR